jgi:hypothetical protein
MVQLKLNISALFDYPAATAAAAVRTATATIHRGTNTVEATAGLKPQQATTNMPTSPNS